MRRAISLLAAIPLLISMSSCGPECAETDEPDMSMNIAASAAVEGLDPLGFSSERMGTASNTEQGAGTVLAEKATEIRKLTIVVGKQTFAAKMANTDAADTIAAMLPMTLAMQELNGNEKYCYLDKQLPTDPSIPDMIYAGDIMLYGDDCLVLFYADHTTTYSYTPIGHVVDTDGLKAALGTGDVEVQFA